ncbi:MAG: NPP1 family protein [Thermocrispum sp.]
MIKRALAVAATAAFLLVALPALPAMADPPQALPTSHPAADGKWQPAFDYDTDGCYPTPAIGPDGTLNPGLNNSGSLNGQCRDSWDLDNTNSYSRSKCDGSGWCAYLYDLYFEKDQAVPGWDCCGHRHDLEHVVVWVHNDQARYVATSEHGNYAVHAASDVAWEGTHPKIVYHKDGGSTHCFRLAGHDEQPENHQGTWQYPDLVGWDNFPAGIRDKLTSADFGSASLGIKDGAFEDNLNKAKPDEVPFNAYA